MVGCVLNPDPSEGFSEPPPGLGDEYWYPLYETLVELDVPALVHSTQCGRPREPYTLHFINEESIAIISLLQSRVFIDFPTLKLVISHGGGSIPYQIGRFRSFYLRPQRRVLDEPFEQSLRRLYFDTCLYSKEALELLFKVVGPDRCLFGAERPGTGSEKDPGHRTLVRRHQAAHRRHRRPDRRRSPADLRGQRQEAPQPGLALARTLG